MCKHTLADNECHSTVNVQICSLMASFSYLNNVSPDSYNVGNFCNEVLVIYILTNAGLSVSAVTFIARAHVTTGRILARSVLGAIVGCGAFVYV